MNSTRLTEFEDGALQTGANPPSTITWFSGGDRHKAAATLEQRLNQVLTKNAWLGGKITKREDGHNCLEYSTTASIDGIFSHDSSNEAMKISKTTPFRELGRILADAGLMLRFGHDDSKPLFLLSIVPSSDDENEFAVIVSLSHIIGDGHTFYSIYNMIMSGSGIEPLQVNRVDITMSQIDQSLGKIESRLLSSGGFIMTAIRGLLSAKLLSYFSPKYRLETQYWIVDNEKMKKLKKEVILSNTTTNNKPSFVSTNDVITSWYLKNSDCRHGMMAINLRGRLGCYTNELAGNYENLIYYQIPDDCTSAIPIRQSLATLKRVVTPDHTPTTYELATNDFAIVSSWATFVSQEPANLGDCQEQAHMPIYDYRGAPSSIAMAFIFRYAPGKLAVLVLGTPSQLEGLQDPPFASDSQTIDYHF